MVGPGLPSPSSGRATSPWAMTSCAAAANLCQEQAHGAPTAGRPRRPLACPAERARTVGSGNGADAGSTGVTLEAGEVETRRRSAPWPLKTDAGPTRGHLWWGPRVLGPKAPPTASQPPGPPEWAGFLVVARASPLPTCGAGMGAPGASQAPDKGPPQPPARSPCGGHVGKAHSRLHEAPRGPQLPVSRPWGQGWTLRLLDHPPSQAGVGGAGPGSGGVEGRG